MAVAGRNVAAEEASDLEGARKRGGATAVAGPSREGEMGSPLGGGIGGEGRAGMDSRQALV